MSDWTPFEEKRHLQGAKISDLDDLDDMLIPPRPDLEPVSGLTVIAMMVVTLIGVALVCVLMFWTMNVASKAIKDSVPSYSPVPIPTASPR